MSLYVNSYVVINEGCPLAISTQGPNHAEIICGWKPHPTFEFVLQREALRALVELGTDALQKMDTDLVNRKVTAELAARDDADVCPSPTPG